MIEAVTDYAIFLLDVNGVVQTWNAGAHRLKGYEAHEVIGQHFSLFYPLELVQKGWPTHELTEAARLGRFEDEGWRLRKDGTRFWANIIITRLLQPTGELRGFCKITRDLTERREHEELVRLSEERFRLLVDNVRDFSIFMLDPSGHVVSWNTGAEKISGFKAQDVIGQHFSMFYAEDRPVAVAAAEEEMKTALSHGRFEDEGWRLRKDGSRYWARVVLTPVHDESGCHRGFAKVTQDLTQTRRVSALEDEGRRVTDFLAMLGHELRNPLAPIGHVAALLDSEPSPTKTVTVARQVLRRQLHQITRLVDDLLDVGRITTGKVRVERKPVDVRGVVLQAAESVDSVMRAKQHHFTMDIGTEPVWVSGDQARLVQVVSNLLGNAAKFTGRGGRLRVGMTVDGAMVEIRVRDNGPGVPPHLQDGVFNLFVQGRQDISRTEGGLGLGLSLAKHLVNLHGGQLELFSAGIPGKGSEFVVRLRVADAPHDVAAAPRAGQPRVLVVDDNIDAANTLQLLVETLGYDVQVVYDGRAAVEAITRTRPDVVLLDIGLPELSGLEVANEVGLRLVEAPALVAVTGYNQPADRDATLSAGFVAHLAKPVDLTRLTGLLQQLAPIARPRAH
ncbi:MAG: putative two component transcriptional regulator, sensor histidine kinase [Panacagrimonas sp.]|jgi:PAS domain S-box-containing protein|nr:putative two component transcriptional regulator, sensor histidine kinase [Panacagrimonas sp.]